MSFASVIDELDALEVPVDGPGLADALACHDRYTAKLTIAVGVFDAEGEWALDGATSMIAWLRERGMHASGAAQLAHLGAKLHRLPTLAAAWIGGDVTSGQVRAVAEHLVERHMGLFASHADALVPLLVGLNVDDTRRAMSDWRAKADALEDGNEPGIPERSLHHSPTLDERFVTTGTFDAEGGAVINEALRLADCNDPDVAPSTRRADAMVAVARFFLDNQQSRTGGRHRPHLNLVVKAETIGTAMPEAEFAQTGFRVDSPTLNRLLCDCAIHRVVVAPDGTILDYGRATRTSPVNLYNAIVVRDRHCRHPGCDRPASWCEAHHVVPWEQGGVTSSDNLVLLCSRHHHKIHTPGWRVKLKPDGQFTVTSPWGDVRTTRPPGHAEQTVLPIEFDPDVLDEQIRIIEQHLENERIRAVVLQRLHALARAA